MIMAPIHKVLVEKFFALVNANSFGLPVMRYELSKVIFDILCSITLLFYKFCGNISLMNMSMFCACIPSFSCFSALLDIIAFTRVSYSSPFCYISSFTSPHITHHAYGHAAHSLSHYGTHSSPLSTFLVFSFTFSQAPSLITRHSFLANPSTCTSHTSHLRLHRRLVDTLRYLHPSAQFTPSVSSHLHILLFSSF